MISTKAPPVPRTFAQTAKRGQNMTHRPAPVAVIPGADRPPIMASQDSASGGPKKTRRKKSFS
jgi:hypothetical protein